MIPADREKKLAQQAKARERQKINQEAQIARLREKGRKLTAEAEIHQRMADIAVDSLFPKSAPKRAARRATRRHNDAPWRNACIEIYGHACISCGDVGNVEMDHIIPKSQDKTARADVENGLPLCGAFSRTTPGGCHPAKTAGTLRFEFWWFTATQITYLAKKGWVSWDSDGEPHGRGMKHFQPKVSAGESKGGQHGSEGQGEPILGSGGHGAGGRGAGAAVGGPW